MSCATDSASTVAPGTVGQAELGGPEMRHYLPHAIDLADDAETCQVGAPGEVQAAVDRLIIASRSQPSGA